MVEHRLPKPGVEGSNPFSRSILMLLDILLRLRNTYILAVGLYCGNFIQEGGLEFEKTHNHGN